jgi:anti-sigma factor RsiW
MRSTHPFELEEVMAYLDGEISADRASEIAQHMQQCAECRELAGSFRNLSHELAAWEVETSPERLTEEMNSEIAAAAGTQPKQTASAPVELTPIERLIALIHSLKGRPWVWAGAGSLATTFLLAVTLPTLMRERTAPFIASRDGAAASRSASASVDKKPTLGGTVRQSQREELQALQKRMAQDEISSSIENDGVPAPPPPVPSASASTSPLIARTASLSLVVKDFSAIQAAVKAVVSRHSGYIGELNTSTPPDAAKTFSATLRVPSAQLEPALAELKQLGRADQESQAGEEVTKQYVDLAARLKNSRATEERLVGVLRNNTGKVKDVLEVENEISRVRGEIEGMEADRRALQTRIDFATITLSVTEEYKASLNGAPSSTGTRLHNAFVTGYHSVVENVIGLVAWLLEAGPTLLLWAVLLFFPVRWAWRRMRRAFTSQPKVAAA